MVAGERINDPSKLKLGDIVHFTKAALEWNRNRDYRVITLRQDSIVVRAYGSFLAEDFFDYTIMAYQLENLGTEIVYRRMG